MQNTLISSYFMQKHIKTNKIQCYGLAHAAYGMRRTVVFANSLINFLMFQCKQVKALQCTKTLNPEQVQPTVNYIESTSNSDNRIQLEQEHIAESGRALKIAFYLERWLILITRNLYMSHKNNYPHSYQCASTASLSSKRAHQGWCAERCP